MCPGERARRPPESGGEWEELSTAVAVARAVAERENCDPAELRPPLGAVIDTDALDTLAREGGTVSFGYLGYDVTIANRRVTVTGGE